MTVETEAGKRLISFFDTLQVSAQGRTGPTLTMLLLDDIAAIESEAAQISALGSYDLGVKEGRAAALREVAERSKPLLAALARWDCGRPAAEFNGPFTELRAILTEAPGYHGSAASTTTGASE